MGKKDEVTKILTVTSIKTKDCRGSDEIRK